MFPTTDDKMLRTSLILINTRKDANLMNAFSKLAFLLVPFKTTQRLTDSWCKCIHCTRCWSLKDPKDDDVSDESFEGFTLYLGKGDARMQLASRSQRSLNYRPFVGAALYYLRELLLFITFESSKGHMWHSGFIDDVWAIDGEWCFIITSLELGSLCRVPLKFISKRWSPPFICSVRSVSG